jgi:hypothetical protein
LIAAIGDPSSSDAAARLATVARPVRVEYGRFGVLAVDGTIDANPFALGFEAAYSWNRTLYTLGTGAYPASLPLPDRTGVLHFGARLEYVSGTTWLIVLEGFAAYTLREPRDPTRGWLFFAAGRYLAGIATAATWAPGAGLQLNLGGLLLTGPSLILAPSVSYELLRDLKIELGAVVVEGPAPPMAATPRMALGTLWDATDRIFAGLIYTL